MIEVANASINTFGTSSPKADFVPPSEQLVTVPVSLLQALQDEVQSLQDIVVLQGEKIAALERTQDIQADNQLIQLRLIADLRKGHGPQPMQKDRSVILRALIADNGGKMLSSEARKTMHLDRASFSRLLATMKDDIEVKPYHLNKSWKVLVLR